MARPGQEFCKVLEFILGPQTRSKAIRGSQKYSQEETNQIYIVSIEKEMQMLNYLLMIINFVGFFPQNKW